MAGRILSFPASYNRTISRRIASAFAPESLLPERANESISTVNVIASALLPIARTNCRAASSNPCPGLPIASKTDASATTLPCSPSISLCSMMVSSPLILFPSSFVISCTISSARVALSGALDLAHASRTAPKQTAFGLSSDLPVLYNSNMRNKISSALLGPSRCNERPQQDITVANEAVVGATSPSPASAMFCIL